MTTTSKKNDEAGKPPVAKLRIGLLNASIWQHSTEDHAFYSVSFGRRYRDGQGEWKSTISYDSNDLLLLAKLADQAHSKILELQVGQAD